LNQTKYTTETWDHEYVDLKMVRLLSRVCTFCEEEGHVIMDCPFVPFHIKTSIVRHTKCGININGSTIGTRTKNSSSLKQIERHGIGKPIGTIKSIDSSIYLN
jgi:hypothetical protein